MAWAGKMDQNAFFDLFNANSKRFPSWRLGQNLFNTAYGLHPSFADRIRASEADPFQANDWNSESVNLFMERLEREFDG